MIQVNYLDKNGESCWADFSSWTAVDQCEDIVEIIDADEYDTDEEYDDYEDDGQPSEYDEWQDYYGGDDYCYGTYGDY